MSLTPLKSLNRKTIPLGLFAALLALDISALMFEKVASIATIKDAQTTAFYFSLIRQPWLWLGLAIGPFQLWVWTRILARTDLSIAFPASSISYPIAMVIAQLVFGEHLSWQVWLGAAFITTGVAVIGSTTAHHQDTQQLQPASEPLTQAVDTSGVPDLPAEALQSAR